jgi:formyltetrahydrofolate deformylase
MTERTFVLTFSCRDRPGIVLAVSRQLFEVGCDIHDSQQYDDPGSGRFFSRIVFAGSGAHSEETLRERLGPLMIDLDATTWQVRDRSRRRRVLLMASGSDHCLGDLLYRWRAGDLEMDVAGIVSNHPPERHATLQAAGVPYHHLHVTPTTKSAQEQEVWRVVKESEADLVVLARYMQILSEDLASRLHGWCINIHHSFLPGFKGARPYQQAYERGVKLIGATAHYVTPDLDEGPIIEQAVEPISHRDTPEQLVRKGKDIERRVLAAAVQAHLQDRVLLNGNKTIVFPA